MPSVDTFVGIEGLLTDIETDCSGRPTIFDVSVRHISFLGKNTNKPSTPTKAKKDRFTFKFNEGKKTVSAGKRKE
jgi:hypothetical protein